jgi:hypothetical protein
MTDKKRCHRVGGWGFGYREVMCLLSGGGGPGKVVCVVFMGLGSRVLGPAFGSSFWVREWIQSSSQQPLACVGGGQHAATQRDVSLV